MDAALLTFRVLRSRTHRLLNRIPEAAWDHVLRRPEGGQRTVAEKLRGDVEHDELHMGHIEQLRAAWTPLPQGPDGISSTVAGTADASGSSASRAAAPHVLRRGQRLIQPPVARRSSLAVLRSG